MWPKKKKAIKPSNWQTIYKPVATGGSGALKASVTGSCLLTRRTRVASEEAVRTEQKEIPGKLECFEGRLQPVVDASRSGWWRFNSHYDRDGYCDNPERGY
jgi:hypothetical protein